MRPTAIAWVRLELDTRTFEETPFRWSLDRAATDGLLLTTMASLGDGPQQHRALYELNRTCAADIPGRGDFDSFEEYAADRLAVPSYRPDGVAIALDGDRWVGLSATSLRPDGDLGEGRYAFSEMTGVLPDYRGHGLGMALKLLAIRFVRERRYRWLRSFHHPQNHAAIAMNLRLGFRKPPGP